jgi:hypothetical protein
MLAAGMLFGCSASVHVSAGSVNDGAYNTKWSAAWSAINRDAQPYIARGSSQGVCNIGGTKQGCYDTDQAVVADLHRMRSSLRGSIVPAQFRGANKLLQRAITTTISGLALRDQAIAKNDDRLFHRSRLVLPQGHDLFQQAYAAYPDYARPQPAPIL